jgi:quercetin dioxygenase-like cupin family protein
MDYKLFKDLKAEASIPENGILSRTLHNDERLKVIVFGFAKGQELTAHTAPMPAAIYIVDGEARLTLGADQHDVQTGAFIHMPPQLEHGIFAQTPLTMLLLMMKEVKAA